MIPESIIEVTSACKTKDIAFVVVVVVVVVVVICGRVDEIKICIESAVFA